MNSFTLVFNLFNDKLSVFLKGSHIFSILSNLHVDLLCSSKSTLDRHLKDVQFLNPIDNTVGTTVVSILFIFVVCFP